MLEEALEGRSFRLRPPAAVAVKLALHELAFVAEGVVFHQPGSVQLAGFDDAALEVAIAGRDADVAQVVELPVEPSTFDFVVRVLLVLLREFVASVAAHRQCLVCSRTDPQVPPRTLADLQLPLVPVVRRQCVHLVVRLGRDDLEGELAAARRAERLQPHQVDRNEFVAAEKANEIVVEEDEAMAAEDVGAVVKLQGDALRVEDESSLLCVQFRRHLRVVQQLPEGERVVGFLDAQRNCRLEEVFDRLLPLHRLALQFLHLHVVTGRCQHRVGIVVQPKVVDQVEQLLVRVQTRERLLQHQPQQLPLHVPRVIVERVERSDITNLPQVPMELSHDFAEMNVHRRVLEEFLAVAGEEVEDRLQVDDVDVKKVLEHLHKLCRLLVVVAQDFHVFQVSIDHRLHHFLLVGEVVKEEHWNVLAVD